MYALCGLVNYLLEHFIGYCFLFFLFFSALFHLFDCHVFVFSLWAQNLYPESNTLSNSQVLSVSFHTAFNGGRLKGHLQKGFRYKS